VSRWYDYRRGRFVQPDTIVPEPGNPQSLNRYSYTRNNPIVYNDPTGHCIVEFSGDVRMDEGPYGTSGLCPNTESAHHEGDAARDDYVASIQPSLTQIEPMTQEELAELLASALVPDNGTKSGGICGAVGAIVYGQVCGGATIDSQGDFYLFWSPESGSMLLGTVSVTGFYATSNADDGELLLGPYMVVGGSAGEVIVGGYEYSTMDSNDPKVPGGKIDEHRYSVGIGLDIGAGPAEAHFGGGTTKPGRKRYNIYKALNVQPPPSAN
ncbi:MAG: hypothetical protein GY751_17505, partial [Bacteroidetes bacterium]|nr:hypothetical protein [Bacteroidota bacterium]